MPIDSHDIAERFRELTHEMYASSLDRDPTLVEQARDLVRQRIEGEDVTRSDRLWAMLLTMTTDDIRSAMLDRSEVGRTLRSGSPFSIILGVHDSAQREALWQRARADLAQSATSNERLAP